ncbi:MAG: hypothetical protein A2017_05235 [Lentisphaerae bacterium GWF2_44_16]|nr:MAG: hypothetical protein A2017_05235 [Lentisphaerae bacterium GWF2_44_16]
MKFNKKILIALIVIVLLLAGGVAGYLIDNHKTLYHFETVASGKIYRSGCLSRKGSLRGFEKVWKMTGLKTIINLRSEKEAENSKWYELEKDFAKSRGINLVNIPMLTDTPPSDAQIKQFLSIVTNPDMLPALIHCEAGVIRTGMMIAVYKVSVLKEKNEKVFRELPMYGHGFDNRLAVKDFILNYGKKNSK